eukprot:6260911-Prymnesium_polylepis.1
MKADAQVAEERAKQRHDELEVMRAQGLTRVAQMAVSRLAATEGATRAAEVRERRVLCVCP